MESTWHVKITGWKITTLLGEYQIVYRSEVAFLKKNHTVQLRKGEITEVYQLGRNSIAVQSLRQYLAREFLILPNDYPVSI